MEGVQDILSRAGIFQGVDPVAVQHLIEQMETVRYPRGTTIFDEGEPGYKALKSILDGTVSASGDNVMIIATSNRRHLLPEYHSDNKTYKHTPDGELHPGEVVEEKISLSERFGMWISFYPFTQDEYLAIVAQWLMHLGVPASAIEAARPEALVWAIERGSRSGRVAYQFARDYAGRDHV